MVINKAIFIKFKSNSVNYKINKRHIVSIIDFKSDYHNCWFVQIKTNNAKNDLEFKFKYVSKNEEKIAEEKYIEFLKLFE